MKFGNILLSIMLILVVISSTIPFAEAEKNNLNPAIDFSVMDEFGVNFSLSDYKGDVIVIHFTGLENPLCIECLEEMESQIKEIEKLSTLEINVTIITINIRKNPYSDSGLEMAECDFEANISWHWVEDYSPYPIATLYQNYWTVDGAFSNPTLLFIDQEFNLLMEMLAHK